MNRETLLAAMHIDTDSVVMYLRKIGLIVDNAGSVVTYTEAAELIDIEVKKWEKLKKKEVENGKDV